MSLPYSLSLSLTLLPPPASHAFMAFSRPEHWLSRHAQLHSPHRHCVAVSTLTVTWILWPHSRLLSLSTLVLPPPLPHSFSLIHSRSHSFSLTHTLIVSLTRSLCLSLPYSLGMLSLSALCRGLSHPPLVLSPSRDGSLSLTLTRCLSHSVL